LGGKNMVKTAKKFTLFSIEESMNIFGAEGMDYIGA
jgi:hypothetical protein